MMKRSMKLLCLTATLLAALVSSSLCAQKVDGLSTGTGNEEKPYCDVLIAEEKEKMQKEADATCTTIQTCVECLERTSGQVIYATLMFQPDESVCPSVKEEETKTDDRGEVKPDVAGKPAAQKVGRKRGAIVNYKVIQSKCAKGGVNLEVYIPGNEARCTAATYKVQWEVDGKPAGTSASLQCVTGKSVKVTVDDVAQGVKTTKLIKVAAGPAATNKAKPKD